MRPSLVLIFLLLLSFLLQETQGTRQLVKGSAQVDAQKPEDSSSLKESTIGTEVLGEVILCNKGHCTGMNRKLIALTATSSSTTTTTLKNEKKGGNKADPISEGRSSKGEVVGEQEKKSVSSSANSEHQISKDHYEEMMDLTEMDYTPARKKPPIHN